MRLGDILEWSAELAGCDAIPADSAVYLEAPTDVRRVLFGIDVDVGELLFAKQAGFDAVIAHHPLGARTRAGIVRVAERQVAMMVAEGIAEEEARTAVAERMAARLRAAHMANVDRVADTGRLVGMPFCNVHLACDILGRQAIVDMLERRRQPGSTVGDAIGWLEEFPEIAAAPGRPEVWLGSPGSPLGRDVVAMAGGRTAGSPSTRATTTPASTPSSRCTSTRATSSGSAAPPGRGSRSS